MTNYIDPGTTKGCAVAAFAGGNFPPAGLVGLGIWSERDGITHTWGITPGGGPTVWEIPQLYPNARREKPQVMIAKANDLIALSAAGATCAAVLGWGRGGVRSVTPAKWKGQLPKPIHHKHVWRVLTDQERALLETAQGDLNPRGKPVFAVIEEGVIAIAKGKTPAYSAKITDLLDAVALGLSQEGRLVLT